MPQISATSSGTLTVSGVVVGGMAREVAVLLGVGEGNRDGVAAGRRGGHRRWLVSGRAAALGRGPLRSFRDDDTSFRRRRRGSAVGGLALVGRQWQGGCAAERRRDGATCWARWAQRWACRQQCGRERFAGIRRACVAAGHRIFFI